MVWVLALLEYPLTPPSREGGGCLITAGWEWNGRLPHSLQWHYCRAVHDWSAEMNVLTSHLAFSNVITLVRCWGTLLWLCVNGSVSSSLYSVFASMGRGGTTVFSMVLSFCGLKVFCLAVIPCSDPLVTDDRSLFWLFCSSHWHTSIVVFFNSESGMYEYEAKKQTKTKQT